MTRSLKGIRQSMADMKKSDNAWADRYVRDVGWLLKRLDEVREVLDGLRQRYGCWCELPPNTGSPDHAVECERASAASEKLRTDK